MKGEKNFKFQLSDKVVITQSGESGEVVGRADFSYAGNDYFVRYKAADGRACQTWWNEGALELAQSEQY